MYRIEHSRIYFDYDEIQKLPEEFKKQIHYVYCLSCGRVYTNWYDMDISSHRRILGFMSLLY